MFSPRQCLKFQLFDLEVIRQKYGPCPQFSCLLWIVWHIRHYGPGRITHVCSRTSRVFCRVCFPSHSRCAAMRLTLCNSRHSDHRGQLSIVQPHLLPRHDLSQASSDFQVPNYTAEQGFRHAYYAAGRRSWCAPNVICFVTQHFLAILRCSLWYCPDRSLPPLCTRNKIIYYFRRKQLQFYAFIGPLCFLTEGKSWSCIRHHCAAPLPASSTLWRLSCPIRHRHLKHRQRHHLSHPNEESDLRIEPYSLCSTNCPALRAMEYRNGLLILRNLFQNSLRELQSRTTIGAFVHINCTKYCHNPLFQRNYLAILYASLKKPECW